MSYTGQKNRDYQRNWRRKLSQEKRDKINARTKEWRENNKARKTAYQENYRKNNIVGFLHSTYDKMKRRVEGKNKKPQYYLGKELLSRKNFIEWGRNCSKFLDMHKLWMDGNHELRLRPTPNRLDNSKGYTLDNMEWLTYSENAGLANVGKFRGNQYTKRVVEKESC